MSSGSCPGTWAPSTMASAPAARAAAQISATGRTSAVGDVMCETETARVRGPMRATTSSGAQTTSVAPANSQVRVIAPYSCVVVTTSSPGASRSERMTAFSPDVALGAKIEVVGIGADEGGELGARRREQPGALGGRPDPAHDLRA